MKEKLDSKKNNIFDLMDAIKAFLDYVQCDRSDSKCLALKELAERSWTELDKRLMLVKDAVLRNTQTLEIVVNSAETADEENDKESEILGICPVGQRRDPRQ